MIPDDNKQTPPLSLTRIVVAHLSFQGFRQVEKFVRRVGIDGYVVQLVEFRQTTHCQMARLLAADRELSIPLVDIDHPLPVVPGDCGLTWSVLNYFPFQNCLTSWRFPRWTGPRVDSLGTQFVSACRIHRRRSFFCPNIHTNYHQASALAYPRHESISLSWRQLLSLNTEIIIDGDISKQEYFIYLMRSHRPAQIWHLHSV